jgi:hypothetical protein
MPECNHAGYGYGFTYPIGLFAILGAGVCPSAAEVQIRAAMSG